jgi:hypothetical protein
MGLIVPLIILLLIVLTALGTVDVLNQINKLDDDYEEID